MAGGDGTTSNHNGTNSMWYRETWLGLERGVAVLMTMNQFTSTAKDAPNRVAELLTGEFEKR